MVQVPSERYTRFKEALAPYKPLQDTVPEPDCADYITDQDGATVVWLEDGIEVTRVFDFGCLDDRRMNDVIRQSTQLLSL